MEEFKTYLMEDLIEEIAMGPFGSNIKVDCFVDSGVPVLNGANLQGFKLREDSFNYVTTEKADSLNKANAYRGDIVITHRGTLGQIVYIPQDSKYKRYVISQSQFRVRVNPKVALPEYVVFYFHTRIGQHRLLANASQVGVPAIARPSTTFKKVEIELPCLKEQKRIIEIINSLSDKIELNNRINHNLEEQARIQFEAWCAKCVESKLIRELSSNILDYTPNNHKKVILLNSSDVTEGRFESLPFVDNQNLKGQFKKRFMKGDILYSEIRPRNHHFAICYFDADEYIASTRLMVIRKNEKEISSDALLYQYLLMPSVLEEFTSKTESRSGTFPQGNYDDLSSSKVPYSSDNLQIGKALDAIYGVIWANMEENKRLASIRDSLLPQLMSGLITC